MFRRLLFSMVFFAMLAGSSWATSGTCTITETTFGSVKKVKFAWTSDSGGNVNGYYTTAYFDGEIIGLATDPGDTAPTDNYDIEIRDENGIDILFNNATNRDSVNTETVQGSSLGAVAGDTLTLFIYNAGDSKKGSLTLWLE